MTKKKKIGVSHARPASEAKPLGTPKAAKTKKGPSPALVAPDTIAPDTIVAGSVVEVTPPPDIFQGTDEKPVDGDSTAAVVSDKSETAPAEIPLAINTKDNHMAVTMKLKGISKSGKFALYSGLRTVTRMSITDFPDNKPVPEFTVDGVFAGPREARSKETKEQRKARLAALPKPTLAEKIAKQEARLAKMREKLTAGAAQGQAAAEQFATPAPQ